MGVYDITGTVPDCGVGGKPEDCAADILGVLSGVFEMSAEISSATTSCGKAGGACGSWVNGAWQATTDFSADLIAAATTCKAAADAPWMCTFDVIAAVDDLNGLVDSLLDSVEKCQKK